MERLIDSLGDGIEDVDAEFAGEERLRLWWNTINNSELRGLFRDAGGRLMIDYRYRADSPTYEKVGPRSIDSNIIGLAVVPVPEDVCEFFGLTVIKPVVAMQERED
jgi:hypothetical protein